MVTETVPPKPSDIPNAYPDEATQAQQEAIENDIKASSPLISQILPLSTLDEDFMGHAVYLEKLDVLKKKYTGIRRLRRDGNCFYRAFGFAYIEHLLTGRRLKDAAHLKQRCDECRDILLSLGYTQFTVEDFHEQFSAMIDQFTISGESLEQLEEVFNNQAYSDYYVVFLRLLVSAYMQKNAEFYMNFIDDGRTINQFCEMEVEPMARESDNIHVAALALAVGIPIWIENCQQSGDLTRLEFPAEDAPPVPASAVVVATAAAAITTTIDGTLGASETADKLSGSNLVVNSTPAGESCPSSFTKAPCPPPSPPPIVLLYRPGHYDILYAS